MPGVSKIAIALIGRNLKIKNLFFTSLDDVKDKVAKILNSLAEDIIHSLTGWQYILDALSL